MIKCLLGLVMLTAALTAAEPGRGIHREVVQPGLPDLLLARDGKAQAEIVVLAPASAVARFAARELKTHLDQATGADFPIREVRSGITPAIVVGGNPWLRGWGVDTAALPRDGFAIRRAGDVLIIAGRDDPLADPERSLAGGLWGMSYERGTLFGVYHFLERFLGVRFYFPGELGTIVPVQRELAIPAVAIDEAPDFPIREMSWYDQPWFGGADGKTAQRGQGLQRLRLRGATASIPNNHGLSRLSLSERFAASNPEYFALLANGQRDNDLSLPGHHGHLCYSDPGLADEIFRHARAFLLGQPAAVVGARCKYGAIWDISGFQPGYFNIMPQDGHSELNFCRCAACAPRYDAGKASDVVWDFTARIAARLQAERIPGEITAMAYSSCLPVPETVIPSNVKVMVALSGPWSERDPAMLATELALIDGWIAKLGRRDYLWNYLNNYAGQIPTGIPSLAPRAIAAYYHRLAGRIDGAFLLNGVDSYIANYLNWSVAMAVLWNTSIDVEAFLAEHHRLMFGAGAAPMRSFHDLLEERWMTRGLGRTSLRPDGFVITPPSDADLWQNIYDDAFLARLDGLVAAALLLAKDEPASRARIGLIQAEVLGTLLRVRGRHVARERDVSSQIAVIPRLPPGAGLVVDGRLDEPAWEAAADLGLVALGDQAVLVHTRVRGLWDDGQLYLGFDCEEPRTGDLNVSPRAHDDGAVWQDSSVEIFLDPEGRRQDYRQLIVNAAGSLSDARLVFEPRSQDWAWESAARVGTSVEAGRWVAELAIPAAALGPLPMQAGRSLVANFNRSRNLQRSAPGENQMYSWSPYLDRSFHDLPRFGSLLLAERAEQPVPRNGGFESLDAGGLPTAWKVSGAWNGRVQTDPAWFRDGARSLRLDGGEGAVELAQGLPALVPGARYRLAFAVRAEGLPLGGTGAGVTVLVLGKSVLALTQPAFTGSFAWSRHLLEFTAPAEGQEVLVRLVARQATGRVWFDSFRLERLSAAP